MALVGLLYGEWVFRLVRAELRLTLSLAKNSEQIGEARNDRAAQLGSSLGVRTGRLLAAAGVRLLTRNGHDFAGRFPLAAAAVAALPARSCLIDGEAIVTDRNGLAVFDLRRFV